MTATKLLAIKRLIPMYKGEDRANRIELAEFKEVAYHVVVGKGQYKEGDEVIFIEPDYCLPKTPLFEEYHAPGGNPNKSKLGKNGRVKAIKFNLSTSLGDVTYSYGIILPKDKVEMFSSAHNKKDFKQLDKELGIFKYTPTEHSKNANSFPEGFYKTDENNIMNGYPEFPIRLIGTKKVDGSSITIYSVIDKHTGERKNGIASRNRDIPIKVLTPMGERKPTFKERIQRFFGKEIDLVLYVEEVNPDVFVQSGYDYLKKLEMFCEATGENLVLRGELYGHDMNGSGNKNNPDRNKPRDIIFFNADYTNQSGHTIKYDEKTFRRVLAKLDFPTVRKYFERNFRNKYELDKLVNSWFRRAKEEDGELIEGIVVHTEDNKWSAKYMNLEYDSKN